MVRFKDRIIIDNGIEKAYCSRCHLYKTLDNYYQSRVDNDGIDRYCKQCRSQITRVYRKRHCMNGIYVGKELCNGDYGAKRKQEKTIRELVSEYLARNGLLIMPYRLRLMRYEGNAKWEEYIRDGNNE